MKVNHLFGIHTDIYAQDQSWPFPNELTVLFFSYLSVKDLLSVQSVCRHFAVLGRDEALWKRFYLCRFPFSTEDKNEKNDYQIHYKSQYLREKNIRNNIRNIIFSSYPIKLTKFRKDGIYEEKKIVGIGNKLYILSDVDNKIRVLNLDSQRESVFTEVNCKRASTIEIYNRELYVQDDEGNVYVYSPQSPHLSRTFKTDLNPDAERPGLIFEGQWVIPNSTKTYNLQTGQESVSENSLSSIQARIAKGIDISSLNQGKFNWSELFPEYNMLYVQNEARVYVIKNGKLQSYELQVNLEENGHFDMSNGEFLMGCFSREFVVIDLNNKTIQSKEIAGDGLEEIPLSFRYPPISYAEYNLLSGRFICEIDNGITIFNFTKS